MLLSFNDFSVKDAGIVYLSKSLVYTPVIYRHKDLLRNKRKKCLKENTTGFEVLH